MIYPDKISKFEEVLFKAIIIDRLAFREYFESNFKSREFKEFLIKSGLEGKKIIFQEQKHTDNIKLVDNKYLTKNINIVLNNDAMISAEKNLYLGVYTADCVPVTFYDPKSKAMGIVHSGWKGTLELIAQKTAKMMNKSFKVCYSDLKCYLGPSIQDCCYEVSKVRDNRVKDFVNRFGNSVIRQGNKKIYLNLQEAIQIQLEQLGILEKNIEISNLCTGCDNKLGLPSNYRERKNYKKLILSIIGIKK